MFWRLKKANRSVDAVREGEYRLGYRVPQSLGKGQ